MQRGCEAVLAMAEQDCEDEGMATGPPGCAWGADMARARGPVPTNAVAEPLRERKRPAPPEVATGCRSRVAERALDDAVGHE